MLRVGLTGGIGSGKSAVAALFAERGVPVLDADEIAHALSAKGGAAYDDIVASFGTAVVGANGELDRAALRARVFADAAARRRLEAILHPRVRVEMAARLEALRGPYALLVVPLLVETRPWPFIDRVLVIDADDALRRARLRTRGLSDAEIDAIFAAQLARAQRLGHADDVIENNQDLRALAARVDGLHNGYLALANA